MLRDFGTRRAHDKWVAQNWGWRLFTKNTGLCKMATSRIESDTCPVLETQVAVVNLQLSRKVEWELLLQSPVNGGRNSDGPKVEYAAFFPSDWGCTTSLYAKTSLGGGVPHVTHLVTILSPQWQRGCHMRQFAGNTMEIWTESMEIGTESMEISRGLIGRSSETAREGAIRTISTPDGRSTKERWNMMKLTAEWIRGFVDGDGCFTINRCQFPTLTHSFLVSQDHKSVDVLYALKKEFGCGTVCKAGGTMYNYTISKGVHIRDICIPFFIQNPLQTKKREVFHRWALSFQNYMIAHHQDSGVNVTAIDWQYKLSAGWFRGFVDAHGCFYARIVEGYVKPCFILGARRDEKELIQECQRLIQCGTIHTRKNGGFETLQVSRLEDLERKLVPFFSTRGSAVLLRTRKRIAFQKFRKILRLMTEKKHLSSPGAEKVKRYVYQLSLENRPHQEKDLIAQDIVQTPG